MMLLGNFLHKILSVRKGWKKVVKNLIEMNRENLKLQASNRIKEKYVGHFMYLCSEYAGNLEEFRKTVANRLAAKRFDELQNLTSSYSETAGKFRELYTHFDNALLDLFPDFVSSVNELLKEEARFEVKNGVLNTELRIFALIRLGITDSEKIASALHCSVQTVRNYRSKIKRNCIAGNADGIEEQIKKIG